MSYKALFSVALLAAPALLHAQETPATFVMKAGASDLYEKQSSQTVLKTTKSPEIRRFAQMMIADHTKTTVEVKAAAMKSGLKPKPPMLDAAKASMVRQLTASTGTARDALYVQQQRTAHQEALSLHQSYSSSGTAPPPR